MASPNKEKILVEMRNYHTTPFADKLSSEAANMLRVKFAVLEDEIIAMLLGLINGKVEYNDYSPELTKFEKEVKALAGKDATQKKEKELFTQKIKQLLEISQLAADAKFTLRPLRYRKAVR